MSKLNHYLEMAVKIRPIEASPKVWNYLKYRSMQKHETTSIKRFTPQIGCILLTARCNLDCEYCNAAKIMNAGKVQWRDSEATLEKVKKIFANPLYANCLLIDLMGGEPFLVKELVPIVQFIAKRGHITNTSTNGLLLLDRIKEVKEAGISRINVSIYDNNRKVLERDLEKINQIFPVHTSLVLLKSMLENQQEKLFETVLFLKKSGCRSLRFWMYRPMGIDPTPHELIPDDSPAYLEFKRQIEEKVPGFVLWPAVIKTKNVKKLCVQPWQRINCDIKGNISICCGSDTLLSGPNTNIHDNHPDIIFNHPEIVAVRRGLLDPDSEPSDMCKNCNLLGESGW